MGTVLGGLDANGFSSPSAPPIPFPPLVPFGVGSESGAQLPGEGGSDLPKAAPRLLTQRGVKVGMAEPARVRLPAWVQLSYDTGPAKQKLLVCLGEEAEISKLTLLRSGVIHLLLEIPAQQDTGRSEWAAVVNIILCVLVLALLVLWSSFAMWN